MDTYTVYFLTLLGNLVMLLMLVIFVKTTSFEGLMQHYIYGKLLQTIGAALGLFRGAVPIDFSIIIGNSVIFIGVALEVYSIVHVDRVPLKSVTRRWTQVVSVIILVFTFIYLAGVNMGHRVFFCAMILALYSLTAAAGLFFHSAATKLRKTLALFFVFLAAHQVIRALDGLLIGESYTLFTASLLQMISFISIYIHTLVSTMAYLLMTREIIDIKLKETATKDYLTGIYNRMYFLQLSEKRFSLLIRQQKPASIFMIDFDYFKVINDTYGHIVGDKVLAHFSRETQGIIGADNLLGRYGGEEFIIFAPNTTAKDALILGQKIQAKLALLFANDVSIPKYTVSIGTATMVPAILTDMDNLIKQADKALLQAKKNGRNQIVQAIF
ncbi:GGDEF domain-containing protein [Pelosinus propionicus]|uniref:GGDEF domain-containing protein n=1 Tax=Pelosinus propionicus TaxID=380084 RepID=UPI0015875AA2|nr:GGDEF domain-containing protein [Pelosinus propionicus]